MGVINIERLKNSDWKFQRFGPPEKNGQRTKMYFGAKLEEMGLVRDGVHTDTQIAATEGNKSTENRKVLPTVWPPSADSDELRITLFIPLDE